MKCDRITTSVLKSGVFLPSYMVFFKVMAVASGLAGPVLARPVFTVIFETAHAQIMNNE